MAAEHIILYAEDDLDDVQIVNEAFVKYDNVQILHANNGWEALHILNSLQQNKKLPCLVILDINMPVVNGKEALKKIRESEELKKLPVVLFSTSSSTNDKDFARQLDSDLITKPLIYEDLESLAEEFVKRCDSEIVKRA